MSSVTSVPATRTSRLAIWSLITSLAGLAYWSIVPFTGNSISTTGTLLFIFGVFGFGNIVGIILGHSALTQIKATGKKGRAIAIAGTALGYLVIVLWAVTLAPLFRGLLGLY